MAHLPDRHELAELVHRHGALDAKLRRVAALRVRSYRPDPPPYLAHTLGPPATDAGARDRWYRTAAAIEHHRLRWQITDQQNALGSGVANRRMQQDSSAVRDEIQRTVEDLVRGPVRHRSLGRAR